jgi:4-amino-4-deoxy-L-arabinose transferase
MKQLMAKYAPWLVGLFYGVAYLLPLNNRLLWIPDETRYAEISREMIHSGDWIVPHLLGLHYFEKPIAGYWLNSVSQLLFGETHFAVRFASALSAGLCGALVFWFALRLFESRKTAFTAAACYLSFLLVYSIGTYNVLDSMVTLWLNLALVTFYLGVQAPGHRQKLFWYAMMGLAAGMGFLTKGFIALAVPVIVALPYLAYRRAWGELRYLWLAVLMLLVVGLPWALAIHLRAPDYWHYFFWVEHIQRFSAPNAQHKAPFWYYLPVLIAGSLPWLGVVPAALLTCWRSVAQRSNVVFLLCWLLLPLLFFSVAKGKLPTYILLCFAPLALLLGHGITELLAHQRWRALRINAGVNLGFGVVMALAVGLLGLGVIGHQPLYPVGDRVPLLLAVTLFALWAVGGWMSWRQPARSVVWTTLCPLALGLLLGWALPATLINSKLPEAFIAQQHNQLAHSRFILANDPGLAVSLAWELKRSDIQLFNSSGEMAYGLETSAPSDKLINSAEFPAWLALARQQGDVALVMRHEAKSVPQDVPTADQSVTEHRLSVLYYARTTHD